MYDQTSLNYLELLQAIYSKAQSNSLTICFSQTLLAGTIDYFILQVYLAPNFEPICNATGKSKIIWFDLEPVANLCYGVL